MMDVWGRYKTLGGACCVVALALLLAGCGSRPLEADADTKLQHRHRKWPQRRSQKQHQQET